MPGGSYLARRSGNRPQDRVGESSGGNGKGAIAQLADVNLRERHVAGVEG